jgi:hypothetical protein
VDQRAELDGLRPCAENEKDPAQTSSIVGARDTAWEARSYAVRLPRSRISPA